MQPNYLPSQAKIDFLRFLRYPRRLSLPHGPPSSGGVRHGWRDVPCTPGSLDHSQLLLTEINLSSLSSPGTPQERLVAAVRDLKPFLPSGCEVLGEGDLQIPDSYPASGGGFADVWLGEMKDGTRVAIKSQRCYSSSSCLPAFLVSGEYYLHIELTGCYPQRMYKEALMYSHLNGTGRSFVPFIAVYSTPEHPFGLVFEFMEHLNLGDYLRNNPDIPRLELVRPCRQICCIVSSSRHQLLEIARSLEHMHGLGIVHGNVAIVSRVLVRRLPSCTHILLG